MEYKQMGCSRGKRLKQGCKRIAERLKCVVFVRVVVSLAMLWSAAPPWCPEA